jgi:mycothiol synthase
VLATAADGALTGYARFEGGDGTGDAEAELVVAPGSRRRGVGRALLTRLEELAGDRPLRVWAHGDLPGSAELAQRRGYTRARVLLQMRRELAGVDPEPRLRLPEGVLVRTFRPGRDEQAWLQTNARAFAHHPEQGSWTPRTCGCARPSRGSTRPASSWPGTASGSWGRTGRRCTRPVTRVPRRSVRSTCWASTPTPRGWDWAVH